MERFHGSAIGQGAGRQALLAGESGWGNTHTHQAPQTGQVLTQVKARIQKTCLSGIPGLEIRHLESSAVCFKTASKLLQNCVN